MAKKFSELRVTMSPEAQARSAARAEAMLMEWKSRSKYVLADMIARCDPKAQPPADLALRGLACDIAANPECFQRIDMGLVQRGRELTAGVKFDMDEPLPPEDHDDTT